MRFILSTLALGLLVLSSFAPPGACARPDFAALYAEDQGDRVRNDGTAVHWTDWKELVARDRRREGVVMEAYARGELDSAADCYHAAMILQHAESADQSLLAHELAVIAWAKGEPRARWLAAASEDRFLMRIGRPQRFATQYAASSLDKPLELYRVDPSVTDGHRAAFGVPSLAQARNQTQPCPACAKAMAPPTIGCPKCGAVYHVACWDKAHGCACKGR